MRNPLTIATTALADAARERAPVHLLDLRLLVAAAALGWLLDMAVGSPRTTGPEPVLAIINIWVQIAIMIASALLSYALAPKPVQPPKPSLEDFNFPTAEAGRPIPVVFGTVFISGANILWYGDLDTTPIKMKGGKK